MRLVRLAPAALAAAIPVHAQNLIYDLTDPSAGDQTIGACGDVNGDGFPDFLVGAPTDDTFATNSGAVRVHSGKNAALLLQLYGVEAHDWIGFALDGAGDVDADGFPDVIAGAGKTVGNLVRVWSGANGAVLYEKTEGPFDFFGNAVTGLGDVDLDGFDDFAAAAPQDEAFHSGPGFVNVYSGATGGLVHRFVGDCLKGEFGVSVDGIPDVNGDGVPELAVYQTAPFVGCAKKVEVYSLAGFASMHVLPSDGPITLGPYGVADAGDLDGDGLSDVVVGNAGPNFCSSSSPGNVKAYSGVTGAEILSVDGQPGCTWLGWAVDGVGDVDADGRGDVAAGAAGTDVVEVYSGADESLLMRIDSPTGGNYGYGLAGLGDLDGDGHVEVGAVGVGPGAWVHSLCPGSIEPYGLGCKGSNDFVPKLAGTGCPNPGKKIVLHVTNGFGGQPAFLAFGTGPGLLPIAGSCNLLVSPLLFVAPIGMLFNFGPGWGYKDVPVTIPPGTSGLTFTVQAADVDPFTPAGFAVSNALTISVE